MESKSQTHGDGDLEGEKAANGGSTEHERCPIEEVALVVPETDDPTLPVMTFRAWFLGLTSCVLLIFLNTFFTYRTQPLTISAILMQIGVLPIGKFMARTLPTKEYKIFGWGFTLNPGPFNIKEHVIITIFANCGVSYGGGDAYSIGAITVMKAYYNQSLNFLCGLLIVLTTQILGYGWAGMLRRYLVDPVEMWWPSNLAQVSLFRALHEKEPRRKGMTRMRFFLIVMTASFLYYALPGYLFPILTFFSWVCWIWPHSITAQQIGSGYHGLGIGAFTLDWAGISAYHGSPLVTPWSSILNVGIGFVMFIYIIVPLCYWKYNTFDARKFPIFSNQLFTSSGNKYDTTKILTPDYQLNVPAYDSYGKLYLSPLFALSIGSGFARFTATLTHVALFHGRDILRQSRSAMKNAKLDIHAKLMQSYKQVPEWWFLILLVGSIVLSLLMSFVWHKDVQLQWWGMIFAFGLAWIVTLPIGVIQATTNQLVGTLVAGTVNLAVAWWMLENIENICDVEGSHPESPWTCPKYRVTFDASVIWGLIGPRRLFGPGGMYHNLVWLFLIGAFLPVPVWILSKMFPEKTWIPLINIPVISYGFAGMPPATPTNIASWLITGTIFNYFVFRYHKRWWQKYNYVLSAALDAGTAFMGVLLFFALQNEGKILKWWGTDIDHCPLATCPTAPGIMVKGCPVFR
ncbi:oligopeptide transporter 3 isoform X2 [Hevea brasiliensis]|uniref:oligopeptide transporter 3 isoform X2 n=1 Tax=Hevea brasiliensis TaxID=3981 RepID=UPI000B795E01|nr:oligopeptide transporter 3 isoform X2 [Hevea brasiliensis]